MAQPKAGGDALLGPGEAARRLGVTTRTVQRWLRTGRLPAVRVGSRLKVPADALAGRPGEAVVRHAAGLTTPRPIRRLLVANRGELVARIARTCRRLGITCLALVTDDQQATWWSRQADERVALATTYLDGPAVVRAALDAGADAIHPGYGFLAEQADFAAAVVAAGLTWVGPPADAMRALGDKAAARQRAAAAGLPVLAGYDGADQTDRRLARAAAAIGWPVLIKPSAGGGGLGMHVVRSGDAFREACEQARREARAAFGDDRLVLERYVEHPRHVEVQVLCDAHGAAIHLGERDCSLQRRHQKVLEEAPAPRVTKAPARPHGGRRGGPRPIGRLRRRRHRRVPRRRGRCLHLHGAQRAPPGRASGHRGRHRAGPRRGPAAGGRRRAPVAPPGGRPAARPRRRGSPLRRGPVGRLRPLERHGREPSPGRRRRRTCASTQGSAPATSSGHATTRSWPRSSPRGRHARPPWAAWTRPSRPRPRSA